MTDPKLLAPYTTEALLESSITDYYSGNNTDYYSGHYTDSGYYPTSPPMQQQLEPYFITGVPCIILSIITINLNIFVINFYRKNNLSLVPILYTLISGADILTAVGVIHQSIAISLFTRDVISETTLDHNTVVCYTLIQISYRSSVFYNLVLAVSRTVMILRPFHQIKIKMVILVCVLYVVPWIVIAGLDIYQVYIVDTHFTRGLYIFYITLGYGLASMVANNDQIFIFVTLLVVAFLLPVIIIIITTVVQLVSLNRSSNLPTSSNQCHVTVTVVLMSTLFVFCNSALYVFLFSILLKLVEPDHETFLACVAVFGAMLPILGSALNPVIIISRSSGLRKKFLETVKRVPKSLRKKSLNRVIAVTEQSGISELH